eukprot:1147937-Pelagomonas_calceolata.AAC.6
MLLKNRSGNRGTASTPVHNGLETAQAACCLPAHCSFRTQNSRYPGLLAACTGLAGELRQARDWGEGMCWGGRSIRRDSASLFIPLLAEAQLCCRWGCHCTQADAFKQNQFHEAALN